MSSLSTHYCICVCVHRKMNHYFRNSRLFQLELIVFVPESCSTTDDNECANSYRHTSNFRSFDGSSTVVTPQRVTFILEYTNAKAQNSHQTCWKQWYRWCLHTTLMWMAKLLAITKGNSNLMQTISQIRVNVNIWSMRVVGKEEEKQRRRKWNFVRWTMSV